ncbi:hypothetical protein NOF04DRAFT_1339117 [Fusarium oxysporum II5]|nr:hypothetical protein NOF04DRAFT_1339117 [Fusarium oxysporum II5]
MGKRNITTNTRNQLASEQKYTRPPRASFGFELEFLVPLNPRKVKADDSIPGLAPVAGHLGGVTAVLELLRDHNFYARTVEESYVPKKSETKGYPWIVTTDTSVSESGTEWKNEAYAWDAVEIASPPMYACDEAYWLVLRLRVNASCGFHVHVGNGPHQMDMHASRNYAALQWASNPVLSTLHCPARSFARYSKSIRGFSGIELSDNVTADMARREVTGLNFISRYIARARKLGGDPVASSVALIEPLREAREKEDDGRFLDPECESDDSDYKCEDGRPFDRPRKAKGVRREVRYTPHVRELINEDKARQLDDESNRTRPSQSTASCRSSDGVPLLDDQWKKLKAVAHLMCDNTTLEKCYSYNWKGKETHGTVESRLAASSLYAEWIVTWIKIQCRMLEWARDAEPSQLMRVIGKLSRDDVSRECTYDVLDFLRDLGSDKQDSGDTWGTPDQDWGAFGEELDDKCRSIEVNWLSY